MNACPQESLTGPPVQVPADPPTETSTAVSTKASLSTQIPHPASIHLPELVSPSWRLEARIWAKLFLYFPQTDLCPGSGSRAQQAATSSPGRECVVMGCGHNFQRHTDLRIGFANQGPYELPGMDTLQGQRGVGKLFLSEHRNSQRANRFDYIEHSN